MAHVILESELNALTRQIDLRLADDEDVKARLPLDPPNKVWSCARWIERFSDGGGATRTGSRLFFFFFCVCQVSLLLLVWCVTPVRLARVGVRMPMIGDKCTVVSLILVLRLRVGKASGGVASHSFLFCSPTTRPHTRSALRGGGGRAASLQACCRGQAGCDQRGSPTPPASAHAVPGGREP